MAQFSAAIEAVAAGAGAGDAGAGMIDPALRVPPNEARETAAARLLREANQNVLRGDMAGARRLAERAHRYYSLTPAGGQATMLLRELLVLEGKEVEADLLSPQNVLPDSSLIPPAVFVALVHSYEKQSQLNEVDRLLRDWGPSYGPLSSMGSLRLALGEALLRVGRADLARSHLEQMPAGGAEESRAVLLLARAADLAGDKPKALELYKRLSVMPAGPYTERGKVRVADLEFQLGQIASALDEYEGFLAGDPPKDEEPWAVYQLGNCYLLTGDPGQARVRYETVLSRWPQSYWAGFARAQLEEIKWRDHLHSRNSTTGNGP